MAWWGMALKFMKYSVYDCGILKAFHPQIEYES